MYSRLRRRDKRVHFDMQSVILISKPSVETLGPALKQITGKTYKDETLEDILDSFSTLGLRVFSDRSILRHLGFSFLCVAANDTIRESLERTHLEHVVFDTIRRGFTGAIISGTIANFRDAITECCDSTSNTDIRSLYNDIYLLMKAAGLRRVWGVTTKKITSDGTFLIKSKDTKIR